MIDLEHIASLTREELLELPVPTLRFLEWQARWQATARPTQLPPEGDWIEWGVMAGRGFGKTRVGAEWLSYKALTDPEALPKSVIAPTLSDVRFTCFEGQSGLLSIIPPEFVEDYNKTNLIITLTNGGIIRGFGSESPERLRGPQASLIWCFTGDTLVTMGDGSHKALRDVAIGDMVMTRKGARRVVANSERKSEVGRVTFENGANLVGTADHPVYTSSGWTRLDQLNSEHVTCVTHAWSGVAESGTPTAAHTMSEPTRVSDQGARCDFIEKYGLQLSENRRKGSMSITGTAIPSTTNYQTWSAFLGPNTHGTITTKETVSSKRIGLLNLSTQCNVPIALSQSSAKSSDETQSARNVQSFEQKGSEKSQRCASLAGRTSAVASETIAVRPASTWRPEGEQSVFCLKVEGEPEYFANGVLVHNCDELAAWQNAQETWDMAMMGLRLGPRPQVVWTTTPKPIELVRKLTIDKPNRVITRGATFDNKANLPKSFLDKMEEDFAGTTMGRQEILGELIDPEEAGIIKRSWFRLWPAKKPLPQFEWIVMSLDTAFTEATVNKKTHDADYSACTVWGVFRHEGKSNALLLDCWQEQLGLPDLIKRVRSDLKVTYGDDQDAAMLVPMYGSDMPESSGKKIDMVIIEDKGSGISLRQSLEREGIMAYAYNPGRADKLTRLHMVSAVFARRQVWLPESEKYPKRPRTWVEPLVAQLCAFTGSGSIKHDDLVDACTQAIRIMMDKNLLTFDRKEEKEKRERDLEEFKAPRKPVVNPYAM